MTLRDESLSKAPFPYFGGKRKAAPLVWQLLGDPHHYVEPFAGSLAVLLERPHPTNRAYHSETVNDADGLIVNVWRSIALHPEETARHASWPVTDADKTARQIAVLQWRTDTMLDRLAGDPTFCDPQMAGWWIWGMCCQIGAIGGPWTADPNTGRITKQTRQPGVRRSLPHLSGDGRGVNRPQTRQPGVRRSRPHLSGDGQGVNHAGTRQPGVSGGLSDRDPAAPMWLDAPNPDGFHPLTMPELERWFRWLSARLRHVRILNGDWARLVTTGAAHTIPVRQGNGPAGVFLDPPYDNTERADGLYNGEHDNGTVAADVRRWAIEHVDPADPKWRVVIAGYDTEHGELEEHGWTVHEWFTSGFLAGGYGNITRSTGTGNQQHRERLWASPQCLASNPAQAALF